MPVSYMAENKKLAVLFFLGLALVAAQMTFVIWQQQIVLNNQAIGLGRSAQNLVNQEFLLNETRADRALQDSQEQGFIWSHKTMLNDINEIKQTLNITN